MRTILSLTLLLFLSWTQHSHAQQEIKGSNATTLNGVNRTQMSKKVDKTPKGKLSVTQINAPTLYTKNPSNAQEPNPVPDSISKTNAPVISNQNQILEPKK
ncbi:MAG: hypothetical protein NZ455_12365 [Bacteroidia bacterium]|nr:hypothetical protein [Bacteroidia bacterium]MDW8346243.1 hypothetical protein [Bacteroidia bacterium]